MARQERPREQYQALSGPAISIPLYYPANIPAIDTFLTTNIHKQNNHSFLKHQLKSTIKMQFVAAQEQVLGLKYNAWKPLAAGCVLQLKYNAWKPLAAGCVLQLKYNAWKPLAAGCTLQQQ
ncbi:hypothetical protein AC579_7330 [Pseudocercospora musae]|uniref:Uncharacterized protein n=1 Tax=Pseudocercospora musae TaxID=113226 RepID=A0A139I8V4_9PEZI|nr:hypothetical protein AC579_7330 [Pseudocercospora musae]